MRKMFFTAALFVAAFVVKAQTTLVDSKRLQARDSFNLDGIWRKTFPGSNVVTGGIVTWVSGLTFAVTAAEYQIKNKVYKSNSGTITLDAAHVSLPRIDVIGLNTSGQIIKITGTAAATPAIPQVNPATQVYLTAVLVGAGATSPGGVTTMQVYDENIEWSNTTDFPSINFASTGTTFTGTVKIAVAGTGASDVSASGGIKFSDGGTYNYSDYNTLRFYIRLNTPWQATASLAVTAGNGTEPLIPVTSMHGFNPALTGVYQNVSVPISQMVRNSNTFTAVYFRVTGNGRPFSVDNISLQGGIGGGTGAGYVTNVYKKTGTDSVFQVINGVHLFAFIDGGGGGGGAVNSVTGTANRITSTGGANPVINISTAFENQLTKYTDTAAMLNNYKHWLAGYTKNTDTAAMLLNYRHWLAGYVKTVTGTSSRITSTGGINPVLDISSTFEDLFIKNSQNNALVRIGANLKIRDTSIGNNQSELIFNPAKTAFRINLGSSNTNHIDSIGTYSSAFGWGNKSKGSNSHSFGAFNNNLSALGFVFGQNNETKSNALLSFIFGDTDTSYYQGGTIFGFSNKQFGNNNFISGWGNYSYSVGHTVFGIGNDTTGRYLVSGIAGSQGVILPTDPIFTIANGTPNTVTGGILNRSNALQIYRDGSAYINGLWGYKNNINGSFTNLSLVTKKYVDSVVALGGGGGSATWGGITGTIGAQADLQAQFNTKLNHADTTNKWLQNMRFRNDSLLTVKNGTESLLYKFKDTLFATEGAVNIRYNIPTNGQTLYVDTASDTKDGILLKEKYTQFNNKMDTLVLTTTGTGAATFDAGTNTLNIPTPSGGGGIATGVAATGGLSITSDGESVINDNTAEIVVGGFPNKPIRFIVNNIEKARLSATNGNLMLQNGGTFTDNGSRLQTTSISTGYLARTAAYTLTTTDHVVNYTSGTVTATLPTAVGCTGREYIVKNSGTGNITVGTTSSQTIDGATTYALATQYKYVHVQSNGANWIIIGKN